MPNCLRRGLGASIACAVAVCGFASLAADGEAGEREASGDESPGVEVSVESYIGVDSRYVTYGLTSDKYANSWNLYGGVGVAMSF